MHTFIPPSTLDLLRDFFSEQSLYQLHTNNAYSGILSEVLNPKWQRSEIDASAIRIFISTLGIPVQTFCPYLESMISVI